MSGNEIVHEFAKTSAKGLLRAAIFFQKQMSRRLGAKTNDRRNTNPSLPGEYAAVVTGALRDGILYEPENIKEIAEEGQIRVGYAMNVNYGAILEIFRQRLGLQHCLNDIMDQLEVLALSEAAGGQP